MFLHHIWKRDSDMRYKNRSRLHNESRITRECQIAYFSPTFGTVVDNRCKIGLVRAIYTPDKLNLTIYELMKRKNIILGVDLGHPLSQGTSQDTR